MPRKAAVKGWTGGPVKKEAPAGWGRGLASTFASLPARPWTKKAALWPARPKG